MIKFLPSIFDRIQAAWEAFCYPPTKVPVVHQPQAFPLQPFRANAGGTVRVVKPERVGPPGHLIVKSADDGETIFFGLIAREAVVAEDQEKFDAAAAALGGD